MARTVAGLAGYFFFGKFYVPNKQLLFLGNMNRSGEYIQQMQKRKKYFSVEVIRKSVGSVYTKFLYMTREAC